MLKRFVFCLIFLFIPLLFSAYAQDVPVNNDRVVQLFKADTLVNTELGVFAVYLTLKPDNSHELFVAKIDKNGGVSGQTRVEFDGVKPLRASLISSGDRLLLFCHVKANDGSKYLYVMESGDGGKNFQKMAALNTTKDVLSPFTVVKSGANIYVAWIDERRQSGHQIYFNYSLDGGKSFQSSDMSLTADMLSGALPTIVAEGPEAHFFYTSVGKDKPVGMYYRHTKDGGKTWSDAVLVTAYEAVWQPADIQALKLKDGSLLVFWYGKGIHASSSKDGINWTGRQIIASNDEDFVYHIKTEVNGGSIYLAANWGNLQYARLKVKPSIYMFRSDDYGKSWIGPGDIRKYKYSSTSAFEPKLSFSKDGKFAVSVWQDHRNIRGSAYINHSADGGVTWSEKSISLDSEPGKFDSYSPVIISSGDDFYAAWYRTRNDLRQEFDLIIKKISKDDIIRDSARR